MKTKCRRCEQDYSMNRVFCSLCGLLLHKPNMLIKVMETRARDGSRFDSKISQAHLENIRGRKVVKTEAQKEAANTLEKKRRKELKAENRILGYVP